MLDVRRRRGDARCEDKGGVRSDMGDSQRLGGCGHDEGYIGDVRWGEEEKRAYLCDAAVEEGFSEFPIEDGEQAKGIGTLDKRPVTEEQCERQRTTQEMGRERS